MSTRVERDLERVRAAATGLELARVELLRSVRKARNEGATLAQISDVAGLSLRELQRLAVRS